MAAYRRVYDSRHLQADCQNRDQFRNPTLGNRVLATFAFLHREAEQGATFLSWINLLIRNVI